MSKEWNNCERWAYVFCFCPNLDNMTPEEVKKKREYNRKKYGLTQEEIDRVVIPVLTEKQTSEVFDKRTSKQLERQQLLSRLAVLRSALQVIRSGSDVFVLPLFHCRVPQAASVDEYPPRRGNESMLLKILWTPMMMISTSISRMYRQDVVEDNVVWIQILWILILIFMTIEFVCYNCVLGGFYNEYLFSVI